jgi:hypothetical protein
METWMSPGQGASLQHLWETGTQASNLLVPAAELPAGGSRPHQAIPVLPRSTTARE